jgi:integrase
LAAPRHLIDESVARSIEAAHVPTLANSYSVRAEYEIFRGDVGAVLLAGKIAFEYSREHELVHYLPMARIRLGWARARLGEHEPGVFEMRQGLADHIEHGNRAWVPLFQGLLADIEAEVEGADRALGRIDEALALARKTGERWTDAFLHRIRGDILLKRYPADPSSAEEAFRAAIGVARHWATADFDVPDNPCENLGRKAPKARERKLTDDELRVFWKACDQLGQPFGPLFQLLLLTGQRRDEVARMTRDELSKDSETWSLPGSRTKNRREHAVPMSPAARELIRGMRRIAACEYIFSTNGRTPVSGFSKAKRQLDAEMADLADGATIPAWRLHDLRRTCASGMAELGVPLQVTEKVLNHVSGSLGGIVSVYQVHDYLKERRDALERWAEHVQKIIAGD